MARWGSLAILGIFIALGAAACSPALPGQSAVQVATATPTWSPPTPTPITFAALNPAQAAGLLGPGDLFPALHALQPHVAFPLRAPVMFAPPLAATGPAAGLIVMPPGQNNTAFATSPVSYAFFDRANIRRRVDIQQAPPHGFGKVAPLPGATTRAVTIGDAPGELQAVAGLQPGDLPRLQLTWEDYDHAYLFLAAGYDDDALLIIARTLIAVP